MYERHPDVSDEELGIRAFQIKKAKSVERAVERIRHALGPGWNSLTSDEVEEFEWILGELWGAIARTEWDDLAFGHLTMSDVIRMLTLGSQLRRHARPSAEILRDAEAIVRQEEIEEPSE